VVQLEDRPWGLALTRGGGLLIVASDDRSTAKGAIMVVDVSRATHDPWGMASQGDAGAMARPFPPVA
jgi:hypothetical protein